MVDHSELPLAGVSVEGDCADPGGGLRLAGPASESFEAIVAEHREPIRRLVYRLLAWSPDAEDVTQEVFLVALTKRASFQGRSSMATWLTRIAVNKCREHGRKVSVRMRAVLGWFDRRRGEARGPADRAIGREAGERVREAVAGLPRKYREAIVLRCLQGMTGREMARAVGITPGAADVRLQRARAMLKRSLADLVED